MAIDRQKRQILLAESADDYIDVALWGMTRECSVMPCVIATAPRPYPSRRELHPALY